MKHRDKITGALCDAGKSLLAGAAIAVCVLLVLTAAGALVHGFALSAGLDLARRGLLILGALALFVSAGALVMDSKAASLRTDARWKKHFCQLGLFGVLFFAAVAVLLVAGILDAVLYTL